MQMRRSGSGRFQCRGWVPEGSGAHTQVSFRMVLLHRLGEVSEAVGDST